ncbi:hypothetical protein KSX47_03995 [Phocaeicola vulgatus]|jgi:hypothetical protein|uniref:hypothetical protein n=1 Tax=Phocaeicola vulgatus TaxID=821 RepID=UPI001C387815|nr:hypothetical protein [Phocaeicola vulgatus]MBV3475693.1 hypothetical protein [Phocaeicola vulgatus]MBV3517315.1 hypothetical protein [Phocaeicola vulgatus]MBV3576317.1 hypothetical protein [Phocaeicola vulgatus]MBV3597058.1 hypothetical protein [Phocaeicola vulgatus]MBV3609489.1 hypothetical protein [Phocaeicola vulgatus]
MQIINNQAIKKRYLNHIKKAVSSEGTAFFMEIFKKDLSISGAMEKILSISINLSRWIVKGFLPVCSISASLWS